MLAAGDLGQTFGKAAVKHRNREALAVFAAQRFLQNYLIYWGPARANGRGAGIPGGFEQSCLHGNLKNELTGGLTRFNAPVHFGGFSHGKHPRNWHLQPAGHYAADDVSDAYPPCF